MAQTLAISKTMTTMDQVQSRFPIAYSTNTNFFPEWKHDLPTLTELEKSQLSHIQRRFLEHRDRGSLPEGTVDKLMISPLLDLAGLYDSRFTIKTEATVEIALEDQGEMLQGRIDTLILNAQIWVLVIEAKNSTFALSIALPQLLTYMLSHLTPGQALFGLVTNGEEFRFVKLEQDSQKIEFDLSDIFSVVPPSRSQLPIVVQILKSLAKSHIQHTS
jgi:Type I restriction enzyme R protein N terminus (HSDR_N)